MYFTHAFRGIQLVYPVLGLHGISACGWRAANTTATTTTTEAGVTQWKQSRTLFGLVAVVDGAVFKHHSIALRRPLSVCRWVAIFPPKQSRPVAPVRHRSPLWCDFDADRNVGNVTFAPALLEGLPGWRPNGPSYPVRKQKAQKMNRIWSS
jgi:hypothetical protein